MSSIKRAVRLGLGAMALAVTVLAGCGGRTNVNDTTGDLAMNFSGFGQFIGKPFYLKVTDTTANTVTGTVVPRTITADTFTVQVPDAIQQGDSYHIDFGIDVDGNGILDASPIGQPAGVDQTWRISDSAWSNTILRDFAYNTDWADISPF